ncbi:MAG: hypothetical protein ALECFALPRED_004513 [Alectoria fallacina]|uniref:FAD-binding PCMH-type domain-containing protein n=1 Tax=Alectoria fallacina TaxID=1903189 RepID=A0A8H3FS30_9LECA|nr:MAG: hypothetical protein ALECFALPRED_004513 [Alectoria fallacina]
MHTSTLLGAALQLCALLGIFAGAAAKIELTSRSNIIVQPQTSAQAAEITRNSGCIGLTAASWALVFYPGSEVYHYENQEFWSLTEILAPSCVFRPTNAQEVGNAVKILQTTNTKFAVRGGGHMGIAGANNINDGVLMVLSNITTFRLSQDQTVLSVGPSYKWGDVYGLLQPSGLAVQGGRLSPIGVPGLLLGGGISFYGNERGFACDDVVNYEIILADGSVQDANKSFNPDLYFALKGGSSNFGIITRFDIETFPGLKVWAGVYSISAEYITAFLEAIANYSMNAKDPKSAVIPAVVAGDPNIAAVILFYNSDTVGFPDDLLPFTNIPSISSTLAFKTLQQFSDETAVVVVPDLNDLFASGTIRVTSYQQALTGINLIYNIFFDRIPLLYSQMPKENITIIEIDWEPITSLWLKASAAKGPNALGLDPTQIYICYAQVVEWTGSQYNRIVYDWAAENEKTITDATQEAGIYDPFHYMGDSAGFQIPGFYNGYGLGNGAKLEAISRKYDPKRVFQNLMPGGFKLAHSEG